MKLVLGSKSPRRQEILTLFSVPFEVFTPPFDESSVPYHGDPEEYALAVARGKAVSLKELFPNRPILTADTVVACEGKVYGKPLDAREAFRFLTELSGRWHTVFTAVVVVRGDETYERVEATKVLFNPLSKDNIEQYLDAIEWGDKAGGYMIQQAGSIIVNRIDGDYFNVVGLPINTVRALLQLMDIDLWQHLSPALRSSSSQ